jgi:plasmid stabilization system protein ParE
MRLRVSPEAEHQITEIDRWWTGNRTVAPTLFLDELAAAFELIGRLPNAGRRHRTPGVPGLRRLLLRATRYHVYHARLDDEHLAVLAVWSAVRGSGPDLRARS